ncbi:KMT5A methyltransferase, partial [Polypterus senegalus]|nr:KMT5A methyltransferase [Polypterus senegalus]
MDAGIEDGSLGRLVNDDPNPNCRMKKVEVNHRSDLCIFALRDIFPKEEITYDYGGCDIPWRQTIKKGRGTSSTNISENSVIDLSTLEKPAVHNQSSSLPLEGEPSQQATSSTNISENSVIDLSTFEKPAVHNQSSNSASKG